ncbi:MAG: bifunctional phosphoribosylaminoimidazolecarboxamide formyltransferase/IMP cyclohydrolase [Bacteroidia bacterium]
MSENKRITSALISVYHKQGLEAVIEQLQRIGATIYSTGGTAAYIRDLGVAVEEVADLTGYPAILGGRVKTLHPKVHGGILARRDEASDLAELAQYSIPPIDLVIVDLYPFEDTVRSGAAEAEVIEQIDIGGIALIRAAAKNFADVVCIPSQAYYADLAAILAAQAGTTTLAQRRAFAAAAFDVSSHYDIQIHAYLHPASDSLKVSLHSQQVLRYGENPHQGGIYYGDLAAEFEQLHGKALSYNNLVDIEAALQVVDEFEEPFFAIIKHTNPCGCAIGSNLGEAWQRALEGDPVSAFGGVLACNGIVDEALAQEVNKLFFEVLVARDFSPTALETLQQKKNRILLKRGAARLPNRIIRSTLGGFLVQDRDLRRVVEADLDYKTSRRPDTRELRDVLFGDLICKHLKSNAIAIVKDGQLIGSGVGQTSRIDALQQAMKKAEEKGFSLDGAVLASDAFFPFADSVAAAYERGVRVIVEPGGSLRDEETINFCESHDMCLIFTGIRHFKH